VDAAMSSSPKFASLLDSVDGSSTVHKLNHIAPGSRKEERKLASNGATGSSMWKGVKTEPSGFWDEALDSGGIKVDDNNDIYGIHSDESTCEKNDSGLSFHFQFSTMPPLHVRDTEAKESLPDDVLPNYVGKNMPHPGSASSENDSMNSLKARRNRTFTKSKDFSIISNSPSGSESEKLESKDRSELPLYSSCSQSSSIGKDSGSAEATSIHNLKSSSSVASNHVVDNHGCTLKSTDIRGQTREVAAAKLASATEGNSHPSTKHRNIEYETVTSSHVANYSANSKSGLKTSVLKVVDQFRGSNLSKHISLAVGSDIAGKYNDKVLMEQIFVIFFPPLWTVILHLQLLQVLFPYESFVKLYNFNKVELRPFGLINCGNR
jgi:ubiquitin carboxyl-terminal hydrolase 36/42